MSYKVLFSVPKVATVTHHPESHACMATWTDLSSPFFRDICARGIAGCGPLRAKSWIVNLTEPNPGVPSQADLRWIETDCIQIARDAGVVAVVNVHGVSAIASMGAKRWNKLVSSNGMTTYDCTSVSDALALAKEIGEGKTD